MNINLSDIGETALIPLAVRAKESERKNARIHDEKAVEIIESLGIDTKNYDKTITHECVVARTNLFDKTLRKYIQKYPDAVCLNLGCGMDNRFRRVDNSKIEWYSIDLPSSIDVRKKVFCDDLRDHMLGFDILDQTWTEGIPKDRMVIVIAEGLLMYFSKEQLTKLLEHMTSSFEHGILLAEMMKQRFMDEKRHETVKHTKAKFGWGIEKTGKELTDLNPKLSFIKETSFSVEMKKSTLLSKILGTLIGDHNNRLSVYHW